MIDQTFDAELDAYLDAHWDEMVTDLDSLVRIQSVEDPATAGPGAPFGQGPARALQAGLDLCARFGARPENLDGYCGVADFPGESATQIGVIGHLDVVPAGEGWHFDPWRVTRTKGYLIGRGTGDDKGPLLMALHAARFLFGRSGRFPYTLRFILGANEETGMADVRHFHEVYADPALVFTPDDEFPVCYGEKGQLQGAFACPVPADARVERFTGGMALNAVPARAEVIVRADQAPAASRITAEPAGPGRMRLVAQGVQAHASTPEGGVNAIHLLAAYLLEHDLCAPSERPWFELVARASGASDGSSFGIASSDDAFGPLTMVAGLASEAEGERRLTIDVRFTSALPVEALQEALDAQAADCGACWEATRVEPVFLMDPQGDFIRALAHSYRDVSGDDQPPFTIGGGTYARSFATAAGFGSAVHGEEIPSWVGGMHAADEGVPEDQLKQAFKVYAVALDRLMKLDL
ncbi:Sapep family Mn(2+)-dependent dipeptidase [Hugonella massiliensis]|uniref:Sapep family Mn(2+)-dependent dipeptidase n=1 Tax=Hugonella massiliensis TaxID=1720315 RepID=UPI00073F6EFD|nr:Sapep family Mn(2+)-dependent dipeptidase [Hugonella massiliensis]